MERRSFLKMLLASPLLGFLKKPDKNIQEYPLGTRRENGDVYVKWANPNSQTIAEEVLLGRIILDGGSITVPPEESWTVTKLRIDGRIGYIYGYINAGGS